MATLKENYYFYTGAEIHYEVLVHEIPKDSPDKSNVFHDLPAAEKEAARMKEKYPGNNVSIETYHHSWICFMSERLGPPHHPYRVTFSDSSFHFLKSADSAITYVLEARLQPDQFQFEYYDGSSWRKWTSETNQTLNDLLIAFLS